MKIEGLNPSALLGCLPWLVIAGFFVWGVLVNWGKDTNTAILCAAGVLFALYRGFGAFARIQNPADD